MNGYSCTTCGTYHPFSIYIKTHIRETLRHTCRVCGAVHSLRDYDIKQIIPGNPERPLVSMCTPAPGAGRMNQLSMWYGAEVVPPAPGQYECRFKGLPQYLRLQWTGQRWMMYHGKASLAVNTSDLEAWRAYVVV